MAEDTYEQFKRQQQGVAGPETRRLVRRFRVPFASDPAVVGRRPSVTTSELGRIQRSAPIREPKEFQDYTVFKATMCEFAEELKTEIRDQHQQTRAEVQITRHQVLAAVKSSPIEYIKLACEFVTLFMLFSLAVRFALKVELVNPAFAIFMLFACAVYWGMASLKQRSERKAHLQTNEHLETLADSRNCRWIPASCCLFTEPLHADHAQGSQTSPAR